MSIADILKEEFILTGADVHNKEELLDAVAGLAASSPQLGSERKDEVFKALKEREDIGSTGFGNGIAIPHCTLDEIDEFIIGFVTVPGGIDFDAIDEKPAKFFAYIIAPRVKRNEHIRYLSNISKILNIKGAMDEFMAAKSPTVLLEAFLRHASVAPESDKKEERVLIHIVVQKEDIFEDVLNVFTNIEDSHLAVIESNNASSYLHTLPLFSSFWNEDAKGFSRIIVGTVKKSLSNELIREINLIIEELEDKCGIMLTAQNLYYSSGSLDM